VPDVRSPIYTPCCDVIEAPAPNDAFCALYPKTNGTVALEATIGADPYTHPAVVAKLLNVGLHSDPYCSATVSEDVVILAPADELEAPPIPMLPVTVTASVAASPRVTLPLVESVVNAPVLAVVAPMGVLLIPVVVMLARSVPPALNPMLSAPTRYIPVLVSLENASEGAAAVPSPMAVSVANLAGLAT